MYPPQVEAITRSKKSKPSKDAGSPDDSVTGVTPAPETRMLRPRIHRGQPSPADPAAIASLNGKAPVLPALPEERLLDADHGESHHLKVSEELML